MGARKKRRRPHVRPHPNPRELTIHVHGVQGRPAVLRAVRLLLEDAGARITTGTIQLNGLPPEETHLVAELDETAIAELHEWMES